MTFGQKLRDLREQQELSQRGLSQKADLALSHIQYLESGDRAPGEETLAKLARALGVDPAELEAEQVTGQVTMLLNEMGGSLTEDQREQIQAAIDRATEKSKAKRGKR